MMKKNPKTPSFAKGGTHWDYYAACFYDKKILARIGKANANMLSCDPPVQSNEPRGTDSDLASLMNIWTPQVFESLTPYPTVSLVTHAKLKPKILLVGSSFFITLQGVFDQMPSLFSQRTFYYYYREDLSENGVHKNLNKKAIHWKKDIFSYDMIVIDANEARMQPLYSKNQSYEIGYGFIEDALNHLSSGQS